MSMSPHYLYKEGGGESGDMRVLYHYNNNIANLLYNKTLIFII